MTILLVTEIFPPKHGGSGRWFWDLYRRLPPDSARVVTHDWDGAGELDRSHELAVDRLQLRFDSWGILNPRGLKRYIRAARHLRRIVRATRPAVIHCGRCVPEGLLALMLRKVGGPPYW